MKSLSRVRFPFAFGQSFFKRNIAKTILIQISCFAFDSAWVFFRSNLCPCLKKILVFVAFSSNWVENEEQKPDMFFSLLLLLLDIEANWDKRVTCNWVTFLISICSRASVWPRLQRLEHQTNGLESREPTIQLFRSLCFKVFFGANKRKEFVLEASKVVFLFFFLKWSFFVRSCCCCFRKS